MSNINNNKRLKRGKKEISTKSLSMSKSMSGLPQRPPEGMVDLRMTRPPDALRRPIDDSLDMSRAAISLLPDESSPTRKVGTGQADNIEIDTRIKRQATGFVARNLEDKRKEVEEKYYGKKRRGEGTAIEIKDDQPQGMFDDITPEQQDRMRAMLNNFCTLETDKLLNDISLKQFGIDAGKVITNAIVQELCTINPTITKLDMTDCTEVSDVGLWSIARHLGSKIKSLSLSGCHQLTNIGLRSLSLKCANLETLDFTGCHRLDDQSLLTLASGCYNLKHMILTDCTTISDNGVATLAQACPELIALDLRGCTNVGEFGDKALKAIGEYCSSLNQLNLMACKRVEDPGLISIANGCHYLNVLKLSGCGGISGDALKALCRNSLNMNSFMLSGSRLINNKDVDYALRNSAMKHTLTELDLSYTKNLTDTATASIVELLPQLKVLNLSGTNTSDQTTTLITNSCKNIRHLDLSFIADGFRLTDNSVHTLAQGVSGLTALKLDGNKYITTKTLMSYIGSALEFCEMSPTYVGYRPKDNCESLILEKEKFVRDTNAVIILQGLFRRKKAYWKWRELRRWWLINKVIPRAQACYRGYKQRLKYYIMKNIILLNRKALIIQTIFRTATQRWIKDRKLRELHFLQYKERCAITIQRLYWGMLGRRIVINRRDEVANEKILQARLRAKREVNALFIQKNFRAYRSRIRVTHLRWLREISRDRIALEERCIRIIQRILRGKFGRIRFQKRVDEVKFAKLMFLSARDIQRVVRGHHGRTHAEAVRREKFRILRNKMAREIQRVFRGSRGRILAAITKALTELRAKNQWYAREIQRCIRGALARMRLVGQKEEKEKIRLRNVMSQRIQRIFRGHKGKEALEIEREIQRMELLAAPLFVKLKEQEEIFHKQAKLVRQLSFKDQLLEEGLRQVEKELMHVMVTNAKFTDCDKITGIPQRFLTKYLRVRLKDHFEHEEEVFKQRRSELRKEQKVELELEEKVSHTRRELVPMTTGLIKKVKENRSSRLRKLVRDQRAASTRIQALWRRALVRITYLEVDRDYWIECYDEKQGEKPYYYNTSSEVTAWRMPRAYKLFAYIHKQDGEIDLGVIL